MPSYARKHQLQRSLIYHVYSRSCNRQLIFNQQEDFKHFRTLLRDYSQRFEACVYHWVIMLNHYHLVIELGPLDSLRYSFIAHWLHNKY